MTMENKKVPLRTPVSWNFFFHEVEWLQTRIPPLCCMHCSIRIGFVPPSRLKIHRKNSNCSKYNHRILTNDQTEKPRASQIHPKNINCSAKTQFTYGEWMLIEWDYSRGCVFEKFNKDQMGSYWNARGKADGARINAQVYVLYSTKAVKGCSFFWLVPCLRKSYHLWSFCNGGLLHCIKRSKPIRGFWLKMICKSNTESFK